MLQSTSTVSPGEDFYRHCNQKWLDDPSVEIPADYSRWGSFTMLVDDSLHNQISLLEKLAYVEYGESSLGERTLRSIWTASMERFDGWEKGLGNYSSITAELELLNSMLDSGDAGLASYLARSQRIGVSSPLVFGKEANLEDSENMILDLGPSGLSLPSRNYYLDEKFEEKRGWFFNHLENVFGLVGPDALQENFAERVLRFETKLAKVFMSPDQQRQFDKYYTITTLDNLVAGINDLNHLEPKNQNYETRHATEADDADSAMLNSVEGGKVSGEEQIRFQAFLDVLIEKLGLREAMICNYEKHYPEGDKDGTFRMMVFDGDYVRRVLKLLLNEDNRSDLRAYLQYKVIKAGSNFATKALNEEFFDMFLRKLRGQKEQKTPKKRSVGLVNSWVDELLGQIYVKHHFSADDKNTVTGLISEVLAVMENSLRTNDWLTSSTKEQALEKLAKFRVKIGYPDKWRDYSPLKIEPTDSLFTMEQKVNSFDYEDEFLSKLNTPKDLTKWEMSPQTVNAYFHPLNNEIVFPAAIIQPPFFHTSLDKLTFELEDEAARSSHALTALNLGGIGAVIAHEITHGYDDQGRKFDQDGNTNDWWQSEDAELFTAKTKLMAKQAEKYVYVDESGGLHGQNPDLTMGENLADLGGLSLAYQALVRLLRANHVEENSKEEVALVRLFFFNWACIWKEKSTEAMRIQQLATDPHAPTDFRGNLVKNIDAFYSVFDVKDGDAMFIPPELRVQMW